MAVWQLTAPAIIAKPMQHAVGSTMTVGGSALSGLEAGSAVGGVLAGIAAIVGLFLTIFSMNRSNRRAYDREIREAEQRGEDRYRDDMIYWRSIAINELRANNHPIPLAPSEQQNYPRPRPVPDEEDEGELA